MPQPLLGSAATASVPFGLAQGVLTPRDIPGLQLWLDASQVVGMRQLSDGTTMVGHGDPVGYWPDLSGRGYHATQTTTNNRPTYRSGVRNGLGAMRFDGVNDSYRVASLPLDGVFSAFVVAQFNRPGVAGDTTGNLFIEHSPNSNFNQGFFLSGSSVAPLAVRRNATNENPPYIVGANGVPAWLGTLWGIADFRLRPGNETQAESVDTVIAYWRNGTRVLNNNWLIGGAFFTNYTIRAGSVITADLFIGSRNQASIFSNGDYAEILIYSRPLSDSEHTVIRRYLATKWAIGI